MNFLIIYLIVFFVCWVVFNAICKKDNDTEEPMMLSFACSFFWPIFLLMLALYYMCIYPVRGIVYIVDKLSDLLIYWKITK